MSDYTFRYFIQNLYLKTLDQHGIHERILYEDILGFLYQKNKSQSVNDHLKDRTIIQKVSKEDQNFNKISNIHW